jgi:hypothetical protein
MVITVFSSSTGPPNPEAKPAVIPTVTLSAKEK